jgi:hypothetical protein
MFFPVSGRLLARGAHERDRTADLILTKDVLYLLSYMGLLVTRGLTLGTRERETRLELATFSLEG